MRAKLSNGFTGNSHGLDFIDGVSVEFDNTNLARRLAMKGYEIIESEPETKVEDSEANAENSEVKVEEPETKVEDSETEKEETKNKKKRG